MLVSRRCFSRNGTHAKILAIALRGRRRISGTASFRQQNADSRATSRRPILKPSLDIRSIRTNPELYSVTCRERNYKSLDSHPSRIVEAHEEWLQLEREVLRTRKELKAAGTEIANLDGSRREEALIEARRYRKVLEAADARQADLQATINQLALELPNLTSPSTPRGSEPKVIHQHTGASLSTPEERDHVRIGTDLGILDFQSASATSGHGFYYLINEAELLEHALVAFARSMARKSGFSSISPPTVVYSEVGAACGFRPRDQHGEQQVYGVAQSAKDQEKGKPEICLAGTAEIPFAGMKAGTTLEQAQLPLKVAGSSRCYRAEAGARGQEARGLYRVHEFTKVEMFAWTIPGHEEQVFDEMIRLQRDIIEALGLSYRLLEMPSEDLGASAYRKNDIEVYFPSRRNLSSQGWGEVTSTSICTDYQSRRLGTRIKSGSHEEKSLWPGTVNGTAMAVPRILAAILETHWCPGDNTKPEQHVKIPACLWPWMDSIRSISKKYTKF